MRIKAVALPGAVATALDENADLMRMTLASSHSPAEQPSADNGEVPSNSQAVASASPHSVPGAATTTDTDTDARSDTSTDAARGQPTLASDIDDAAGHSAGHTEAEATAVLSNGALYKSDAADGQSRSSAHDSSSTSAAEALSDSERVSPSHLGSADGQEGSQARSQGGQHGVQQVQAHAGELSGIDGTQGRAMAASSNGGSTDKQDDKEGQSVASGKVGVLKQRLVAAAKEAQAGSPNVLKVCLTLRFTAFELDVMRCSSYAVQPIAACNVCC